MKNFFLLLFAAVLLTQSTYAQQIHFIYIQSDNKQQFVANVNNKAYPSSELGYVIIPKLTDGQYDVNINFPDNSPSQKFTVSINNTDAGYQLKNFPDKGWGLFNLQTMDVVMANGTELKSDTTHLVQTPVNDTTQVVQTSVTDTVQTPVADTVQKPVVKKTNTFGDILSSVVNDSTLTSTTPVTAPTINPPPLTGNAADVTPIVKLNQQSVDEGTNLTFLDKTDTVNITIPTTSAVATTTEVPQPNTEVPTTNTSESSNTSDTTTKQTSNPFYSGKDSSNATSNKAAITNSNCQKIATDDDLSKLRKKMITESDPYKMISLVKKNLKGKCLNTDQVRNLGVLFLSDESRYNFFEAMYNSVTDFNNYSSLENQLIDTYYKKRFQTMLR